MTMRPLLVLGPDSTLNDTYRLAVEAHPERDVAMLHIPSSDYYDFDLSGLAHYPAEKWDICIAANEFYINDVRRALHTLVVGLGYQTNSLISSKAHIDPSVTIGQNTIIYPGCFIGAGCNLGTHCVLRPNVVLSEQVELGNYVTLEANVSIREYSKVGDFSTLCANTSLARMTEVGAHCYINIPRQYSGKILNCTFYSPSFENPVRIFPC